MSKTLYIEFTLESGKTYTFRIDEPNDDITKSQVDTLTAEMISKKAIVVNGYYATAVKQQYIRQVENTELE